MRPYDMNDFSERLPTLEISTLAHILTLRSETDDILNKILSVVLVFQEPFNEISQITKTLDYAIHVPEFVPYPEDGYDIILDTILLHVEKLAQVGNSDLAREIAEYALKKGSEMQEQFEDGFSWNLSLKEIEKWLAETGAKNE